MSDEELERLAAELWLEIVSAIDALVARAEGDEWRTRAFSELAADDKATAPFQTSHAVQMLLNAGIDSLNGVRHLIWGRPGDPSPRPVLHQAAHYVLARAAIENFSTALWLLAPPDRPTRIERTLRWHMQNVIDQHAALDGLVESPPSGNDKSAKLARLVQLTEATTGPIPKNFRKGYSATEVLRYADETNPDRGTDAFLSSLRIWQLCSGFAHGRPWASLTYLEQERRPTANPDVISVRLTSDMTRALLAPKEALHLLERLLKLLGDRNAVAPWADAHEAGPDGAHSLTTLAVRGRMVERCLRRAVAT